jgi:hypothetical protein
MFLQHSRKPRVYLRLLVHKHAHAFTQILTHTFLADGSEADPFVFAAAGMHIEVKFTLVCMYVNIHTYILHAYIVSNVFTYAEYVSKTLSFADIHKEYVMLTCIELNFL